MAPAIALNPALLFSHTLNLPKNKLALRRSPPVNAQSVPSLSTVCRGNVAVDRKPLRAVGNLSRPLKQPWIVVHHLNMTRFPCGAIADPLWNFGYS
ncbi:MAG: hypothetical protein AAFY26_04460 [Cyanobacteria bacterium J06638_22]